MVEEVLKVQNGEGYIVIWSKDDSLAGGEFFTDVALCENKKILSQFLNQEHFKLTDNEGDNIYSIRLVVKGEVIPLEELYEIMALEEDD